MTREKGFTLVISSGFGQFCFCFLIVGDVPPRKSPKSFKVVPRQIKGYKKKAKKQKHQCVQPGAVTLTAQG